MKIIDDPNQKDDFADNRTAWLKFNASDMLTSGGIGGTGAKLEFFYSEKGTKVPEPASLGLLSLAMPLALMRRRARAAV